MVTLWDRCVWKCHLFTRETLSLHSTSGMWACNLTRTSYSFQLFSYQSVLWRKNCSQFHFRSNQNQSAKLWSSTISGNAATIISDGRRPIPASICDKSNFAAVLISRPRMDWNWPPWRNISARTHLLQLLVQNCNYGKNRGKMPR